MANGNAGSPLLVFELFPLCSIKRVRCGRPPSGQPQPHDAGFLQFPVHLESLPLIQVQRAAVMAGVGLLKDTGVGFGIRIAILPRVHAGAPQQ